MIVLIQNMVKSYLWIFVKSYEQFMFEIWEIQGQ